MKRIGAGRAINDLLNSGRTQTYDYDKLNRLTTAASSAPSGPDAWSQTFSIDAWGNTKQSGTIAFSQNFDQNNRISAAGYTYDAAGNLTNDSFRQYAYDAENRLQTVNTNAAIYTYDGNGNRIRKDVGGDWTEYIYFNGKVIAEQTGTAGSPTGNWADYIYRGSERIAKAGGELDNPGFESGIDNWVWGGTVITDAAKAHSGSQYLEHSTSGAQVVALYLKLIAVQPGEVLHFGGWVYRESGDGYAEWKLAAYDSSQTPVAYPGSFNPSAGSWQLQDETYTVPSGVAYVRLYCEVYLASGPSVARFDDGFLSAGTEYYHGDHLGSARMITDASGAVTWSATYLPFGYEINPQSTTNHYKFTAKERDSESGLDYFGARHYASTMGRFMTPDPLGGHLENPQIAEQVRLRVKYSDYSQ